MKRNPFQYIPVPGTTGGTLIRDGEAVGTLLPLKPFSGERAAELMNGGWAAEADSAPEDYKAKLLRLAAMAVELGICVEIKCGGVLCTGVHQGKPTILRDQHTLRLSTTIALTTPELLETLSRAGALPAE